MRRFVCSFWRDIEGRQIRISSSTLTGLQSPCLYGMRGSLNGSVSRKMMTVTWYFIWIHQNHQGQYLKQQMRGYLAKNCLPILLYSVVLEDETREVELNTKHMRQETIKIKQEVTNTEKKDKHMETGVKEQNGEHKRQVTYCQQKLSKELKV